MSRRRSGTPRLRDQRSPRAPAWSARRDPRRARGRRRYRAGASPPLRLEGIEQITGKRLEECGGHAQRALRQADRPRLRSLAPYRSQLGHGRIATADKEGFAALDVVQVPGKVRLGVVDVDPLHVLWMSHVMDQVNA